MTLELTPDTTKYFCIKEFSLMGSVEIPDLTSLPEIHDEPVFNGYRKEGVTRNQRIGVT